MEMEAYPRFAKAHNLLPKHNHNHNNHNHNNNYNNNNNINMATSINNNSYHHYDYPASYQPSLIKTRSSSSVEPVMFRSASSDV